MEHISRAASCLEEKLNALKSRNAQIRHVCCIGLAASVEFYDTDVFENVRMKAKENGLILGAGENNKIVIRPPYVISEEEIGEVTDILEGCIRNHEN